MVGTNASVDNLRDEFAAELTDAAFQAASRYGVNGPSVDQELDLWRALGDVVRKQQGPGRARPRPENLVAELTDAAYRVTLEHGFRAPFVDVRLGLWEALCQAVRSSGRLAAGVTAL
jgi:hypothetical protein